MDIVTRLGFAEAFFGLVLVAPPIETVLGQWAPISITKRFTNRVTTQVVVSTAVFALPHMASDVTGTPSIGITGVLLACTFVHWRLQSTWKALWTTTLLHSLGNAIAVTLGYFLTLVSP